MDTEDTTFRTAVAIITVGMVLPAFPVALGGDVIVASLTYEVFLTALAVGFGVLVFVVVERLSLDRITFAFALFVWPWIVFFTALFGILLLNEGEQIPEGPIANVVRTLYGSHWIWGTEQTTQFAYGAVFTIAGLGAIAISALLERRSLHPMERSE